MLAQIIKFIIGRKQTEMNYYFEVNDRPDEFINNLRTQRVLKKEIDEIVENLNEKINDYNEYMGKQIYVYNVLGRVVVTSL